MTGAALDFGRFDLKVGNWSQYGRYFQAKPWNSVSQLVECSTGDQTRVACLRLTAWSHCVVSFQKQDILSAAALVLVLYLYLYLFSGRIQFWHLQPRCVRYKS